MIKNKKNSKNKKDNSAVSQMIDTIMDSLNQTQKEKQKT